jgi:hypothetical protein
VHNFGSEFCWKNASPSFADRNFSCVRSSPPHAAAASSGGGGGSSSSFAIVLSTRSNVLHSINFLSALGSFGFKKTLATQIYSVHLQQSFTLPDTSSCSCSSRLLGIMSSLQSPPKPWERAGAATHRFYRAACCKLCQCCPALLVVTSGVASIHQSSSTAATAASPRALASTPAAAVMQSPVVTSPYSPHALAPSAFSPAVYGAAGATYGGGYGMQVRCGCGTL